MTDVSLNGHGEFKPPKGWLLASQLVKEYGGALRTAQRWGAELKVENVQDAKGVRYFNPESYLRVLESEDVATSDVAKTGIVLSGSNELLKQTQGHLERVLKPAFEGSEAIVSALLKENASQRELIAKLTATHLENVKAREESLSQAHERAIMARVIEASEERKRMALDMLKQPAKLLLAKWAGVDASSGDTVKVSDGRLDAVRRLLASLTDEQLSTLLAAEAVQSTLQAVLDTDMVSEEQKGMIREVLL